MDPSPFEKPASLATLRQLAAEGVLTRSAFERGAALLGARPTAPHWLTQGRFLLLWTGALLGVAGVIFFIAANWNDLHPYARLFLMVCTILASAAVALRQADGTLARSAAVAVCTMLWGPLLALYGQTYQTGADAWGLFAAWALLVTPFAWMARTAVLWIIWMWLLQLAGFLYADQVLMLHQDAWVTLCFTVMDVALVAGLEWKQLNRWAVRAVVLKSQGWLMGLSCVFILGRHSNDGVALVLGLITTVACWAVYRHFRRDLFLVALAVASAALLFCTLIIRGSMDARLDVLAVFLDGAVILVVVGLAVRYLRALHDDPAYSERSAP